MFWFLSHAAVAQFTYVLDQSIPVSSITDEVLSLPWAGGLNASQFNTMDLNNDGLEDLVIYDRMAGQVIPFLQDNEKYRYAPEYQNSFPEEIEFWMLLRDYNGDGRKDIFTGDNLGMKVFENVTTEDGLLEWKHVLFFTEFPGPKSNVLLTRAISYKINLQLNYDDLPSINDADGDGDLDIFNAGYSNNSKIEYHKNLSIENYGTLDSLDFERITQSWGGVENCDCGGFSYNNVPCDNNGGKIKHAGGKSILAMDIDNDDDQDVLFSESECTQLFLLQNNGTNESPLVNASSAFPANSPAYMVIYPSPYYEDVDFDGNKDLLVSPNIFTREFLQTNLRQSIWFYKNTGSTNQPVFNSPNIDFLQENMVEVGENAAPVFFDTDGDGDLDLLVGTYANNFRGSVYFFENTGTQSHPEFKLITEDFQGLSLLNFINIRPMFADMNGDTKWDFVFTATDLNNGGTQLYYLLNEHSIGAQFETSNLIPSGFFVFPNEPITLADVNLDRKMDLLIGRQNGSLEYWKNIGTEKSPAWAIEDESFLGLGSDYLRQYPACATYDLDDDSKTDLIIGDQKGSISVISDYRQAGDATFLTDIIYNPLSETYQSQPLGGRAWPTVANIFKADKPAIIVGNELGGIHILRPSESTAEPKSPIINVYPNPVFTNNSSTLTIQTDRPAILYTLSLLGQQVLPTRYLQAAQEYQVQLPPFQKEPIY